MAVGFGHDGAGSGVEVVERENDVDARPIVARAGFNGLHIFLAARGGDRDSYSRILPAHLSPCTKTSFRTSKHRCASSIACREEN
jgi:hypothetical protein